MKIKRDNCLLPVSEQLCSILETEIAKSKLGPSNGFTLNFRDPDYSSERGGFHPVEIAVCADGSIHYITDFSYVGMPPMTELAKEIDFDFQLGLYRHFDREFALLEAYGFYPVWEVNFCTYYQMGAYQVEVGEYC